ncbi:hypothetical protein, partial [Streptomyces sp. NPDC041003]|uniref:hypothetical protein n=1 Tax=Streptomyces sp. NPDC041003 TaxID=3155730 RepID=UPI0033D0EE39
PADVKGPQENLLGAFDLRALGRIRTCNLLIRRRVPLTHAPTPHHAGTAPSQQSSWRGVHGCLLMSADVDVSG